MPSRRWRLRSLAVCIAIAALAAAAHAAAPRTAHTWGWNFSGQLGLGEEWADHTAPVQVPDLADVHEVAAGGNHTLVLLTDGTLKAWGQNDHGQLGDGSSNERRSPVPVSTLTGVVAIAAGYKHNLALRSNGTVWAWGANGAGQLGDGTRVSHDTATQVAGLTDVVAVAVMHEHSLALKSNGTIWAWGANSFGELGDGTMTTRLTPIVVPGLTDVVAIAAGFGHSAALRGDGTVWAWGWNDRGQLGDGTTTSRYDRGQGDEYENPPTDLIDIPPTKEPTNPSQTSAVTDPRRKSPQPQHLGVPHESCARSCIFRSRIAFSDTPPAPRHCMRNVPSSSAPSAQVLPLARPKPCSLPRAEPQKRSGSSRLASGTYASKGSATGQPNPPAAPPALSPPPASAHARQPASL